MKALANVEPKEVLEIFEEISKIPRGSGNEKAVSDFIANVGKCLGLTVYQDAVYNVIIKKNGTPGYENSAPVILQGHIDMVCEKNASVIHDFYKDPIKLQITGDFITALGTTLGADNGIAVAYMLAVLNSQTIAHPPIEAVFTSDEEAGMNGARALDYSQLVGKQLINLDSEEEGHILTSCAGGLRASITLPVAWTPPFNGSTSAKIIIKGLKGGHSGSDINLQRANANNLMGRLLKFLTKNMSLSLGEINGGNMDNAIPRESFCTAVLNPEDIGALKGFCDAFKQMVLKEYRNVDENIDVEIVLNHTLPEKVLSQISVEKAIAVLILMPYGVKTISTDIAGLVESSNNLGIVRTTNDAITFTCATRSSVGSRKTAICDEIETIALITGGKYEEHGIYPAWEYNPNSQLRQVLADTYQQLFEKEAKIDAIHAGLECGLFSQRIKNCDMVSIGPDMADVHTPDERLSIASTARTWVYLKQILKNLK